MHEVVQEKVRELKKEGLKAMAWNNRENNSQHLLLGTFLYGSQNYGLDDEQSDIDVKYIYMPDFKDRITGHKSFMDFLKTEHTSPMSIQKLFELLKKSNPNALELISTDYCSCSSPAFVKILNWLYNNRQKFAYLDPSSWLEANFGIGIKHCTLNDKALVYSFLAKDRIEKYLKKDFYFDILPVSPEKKDFYMKLKRGGFAPEEVDEFRFQLLKEFQKIKDKGCPFKPENQWLKDDLNDMLIDLYREVYCNV